MTASHVGRWVLRTARNVLLMLAMIAALLVAAFLVYRYNREAAYTDTAFGERFTYTPRSRWSSERRALSGFENATDVQMVSLASFYEGEKFDQRTPAYLLEANWCRGHECLDGYRVLGRVAMAPGDRAAVTHLMTRWLRDEPDFAAACAPEFRHALTWRNDGKRYALLLCYGCGIYELLVDGEVKLRYGQGGHPEGEPLFNARLAAAGIPYYDDRGEKWIAAGKALP